MDSIRIAKVERVQYNKGPIRVEGTLHLTAHHLIFKYEGGNGEQEVWIPYPLISTVTRLPLSLYGQSPLAFGSRNFEYFTFVFTKEKDAMDVFESVKELTVSPSVTSLYAYFYQPNPPLSSNDGWFIYNSRQEFTRMGIGSRTKAWRFTDINKDYTFCPTYPSLLVVPAKISDTVLTYGGKYRSKARIPAASITRSSQPAVGLTNNRSIQDEKLIEAIFQSHHLVASPFATIPQRSTVFGATATNLIIDARSGTSGVANVVRGGGTENMDYYREGRKAYLGVENIHVMRDSLAKVVDVLREGDTSAPIPGTSERSDDRRIGVLDRQGLRRSGWLKHISALLEGAVIIIKNVHINSSHVLIHCSDGWDRTAQLSSLSQLCLDPYYRTYRGFQVLIEKDWVSFGHRFLDRCGHLSSEKFFLTLNNDGDGPQTFLASVQNKFVSPSHLKETSPVFHQFLECVRQIQRQYPKRFEFNERFLERLHYHVYSCQFGTFLFNNERDRRFSVDGASKPAIACTQSVWDFLNSESEKSSFLNPDYDSSLDSKDDRSSDMGVLIPNPKDVRFWHELYGRTDEEMNGRSVDVQTAGAEAPDSVDEDTDGPAINLSSTLPSTDTQELSRPFLLQRQASFLPPAPRSPSPRPPSNTYIPPLTSSSTSVTSQALESRSTTPPTFPSPSSPSAIRRQQTGAFGLPTGGMKSMWAQFSSNASAAFSAVQEAYDGAAKELLGGGEPLRERGRTRTEDSERGTTGSDDDQRQPTSS
ncbi:uncharacterized protein EI90DRAFT_3288434 [Cantharellus anzutake]|uniref:uncharacterized protein n=1 Tax=Cantharellus anzutake TaxID=1750568 RepID=UPI00190724C8|nr:uncharacterized protein EI90DRAFT_3288434 [Cantharellus anzutake]KAF8334219.1 hypothetical protein EI90DRAFT_3288434 [Cantharellus anzutake]